MKQSLVLIIPFSIILFSAELYADSEVIFAPGSVSRPGMINPPGTAVPGAVTSPGTIPTPQVIPIPENGPHPEVFSPPVTINLDTGEIETSEPDL